MEMTNHKTRFNEAAAKYQSERYPGRGHCARLGLDFLAPCAADLVLDLGCGPGEHLIALSPAIKAGYGLDFSEEMIRQARERSRGYHNLHFCVGAADQLPEQFPQIHFTKIFTNYTLHHLPATQKAKIITLISDRLVVGGRFILGDLMFSEAPEKYESLYDYVGYGPGCDTPSRVEELEAMFSAAGLESQTRILNPLVGLIIGHKPMKPTESRT
jgi:SAM-dependent methyltransferase